MKQYIEENRLIAEFLGWKEQVDSTKEFYRDWFDDKGVRRTDFPKRKLRFHHSYDELMPVLTAIQSVIEDPLDIDHLKDSLFMNDFYTLFEQTVDVIKDINNGDIEVIEEY